ncbi:MAG TPA: hypothetical protein PLZ84_00975 [Clostridia bacterium]|nr:hypothetical protein [Clostridia bacterium]
MDNKEILRLRKAMKKRALGYKYQEEVSELKDIKDDEGKAHQKMVVTKVIQKEVQPDTAAIKYLLENQPEESESIEDILKEKERIIREFLNKEDD